MRRQYIKMANPNSIKNEDKNLQTSKGTGTGKEPETKVPLSQSGLTEEERIELAELREIKRTTGFTKFAESAKEAQRLLTRNGELEGKLAKANEALTEKEFKDQTPDFEGMDEDEKKKALEDFKTKKRLAILEAKEKWRDEFRNLPQETLDKIAKKGGEESFKKFACRPGAEKFGLDELAKSFLYEEVQPPITPKPGLETIGGGVRVPEKPQGEGYTVEEISVIRKTDPKRYAKLAQEGKLKIKRSDK